MSIEINFSNIDANNNKITKKILMNLFGKRTKFILSAISTPQTAVAHITSDAGWIAAALALNLPLPLCSRKDFWCWSRP